MSGIPSAVRGMRLAQKAIRRFADGDQQGALLTLQDGSHEETTWAAASLLAQLTEAAERLAGRDPAEARQLLHVAADGIDDDIFDTGARLVIQEDTGEPT